jgi:hypothetical protein
MTPRIHFVSFATPSFRPRQWLLERSAKWLGMADVIHSWSPTRLAADGFTSRHADLFPGSKGFGWYAWKPYIIQQALRAADDGDLIVYQDCGRRDPILIRHHLSFWQDYLNEYQQHCVPGVLIPWWGPNRLWTKQQTLTILNMDEPRFRDCPQVQASWSVWRKCPQSIEFIKEWTELCSRRRLVSGDLDRGIENETNGFIEHRWDQSLLTLLTWKNGLKPINSLQQASPEMNEKSCDAWMRRLDCKPAPIALVSVFNLACWFYIGFETSAKIIFSWSEFVAGAKSK